MKPKIAVAGATGFIGRWFIDTYKDKFHIIGLTRKNITAEDTDIEWRQTDLYSATSIKEALRGVDYALYLVHSMKPSTRLNQGGFEDTDLLLADNFARGAAKNQLKQIIYMSGILPEDQSDISIHLKSRYEVEQTLGAQGTPVTTLRAGIVIGPGGSSFTIVEKLAKRLPIMICPKWTQSYSNPISIWDTLKIIEHVIGNEKYYSESIEIGSDEKLTYMEMLKRTSEILGKKRIIFSFPFFTPGLSKLWVALFSNNSKSFVSPLIDSLKHELILKKPMPFEGLDLPGYSFNEAAKKSLYEKDTIPSLPKSNKKSKERNTVRSVQRLPNPGGQSALWVANQYQKFLPKLFRYIMSVNVSGDYVSFHISFMNNPLLKLYYIEDRSNEDRQLFYIVGGLLVKRKDFGWLEFRRVLDGKYFVAAIHEFVPKLPWFIYVNTQAVFHLWVMNRYSKYLGKKNE